ncbi:hypothetical protein WJX73_004019 [Symbiochloris irregularis]|uniref:TFIIE beta domain-containing protein n=1 Tax=Symbiochloris irregularis TaxID=706552 RepID=A0AAW1PNM5_9CHLO
MSSKREDMLESWRKKKEERAAAAPAAKKAKVSRKSGSKPKAAAAAAAVQPANADQAKAVSSAAQGESKAVPRPVVKKAPAAAPLGMQFKRAVDFLQQRKTPIIAKELEEAIQYSVDADSALGQALRKHPRVEVSASGDFCYKAEHVFTSREDILKFLRTHPEGVHLHEIQDSYENAERDVEKLKAAGLIIAWKHWETEKWIMYPKARTSSEAVVDDDVVAEWLKQPIPIKPGELEAALKKAKVVQAPRNDSRKAAQQQKEKKRKHRSNWNKATNIHMPELFQGQPQATQID